MADDKTEDTTIESEEVEEPTTVEEPKEVEAEPVEEEAPAEPEAEPADEPIEEPQEEPAPPVTSQRENKRIAELTRKLQEAQQPQFNQPQVQQPNIAEGDYDVEQLNGMFQKGNQQAYDAGLARANAIAFNTDLKLDLARVVQKHDFLDKDSQNFDPGDAAYLNEKYLKMVGYNSQTGEANPNYIGYEEFVEGEIEFANKRNAAQAADSTRNLAKQAAQTGVRPNTVAKKNYEGTDPSKMTLEQLQAAALQEAKTMRF